MSYDENQLVKVKWNNTNRKWYESKGYVYTKRYDEFEVLAKDLTVHSDKKIVATCDYCGSEYVTQYAFITNGRKDILKDCCSSCAGIKASEVSIRKRANKYIGIAKKICDERGYKLITTIEEYTDVKMNIEFVCPKHGKQTMMLENFINGHECIDCSYEKRAQSLRYDVDYVKHKIESVNGNILLNPEDYQDVLTRNLNIKCKCGNIFTTSFNNYTKYNVNTCFSCSCKESSGEKIIREFLEKHCVEYEQEKRFVDCRDKKPLPFDFYLPEYNTIIEFDGQHHYTVIRSEEHYMKTVEHDKIKNEYCKLHDILLIRIPYWEGNNIENIIAKELNIEL